MRAVATLSLSGAVAGTIGGVVFWAVRGGMPLTRALAYGFWFAAAACLAAMLVTASRRVWRALPVAAPEGWVFTAAAVVLTLAGGLIDALGAG